MVKKRKLGLSFFGSIGVLSLIKSLGRTFIEFGELVKHSNSKGRHSPVRGNQGLLHKRKKKRDDIVPK